MVVLDEGLGDNLFCILKVCVVCIKVQPQFLEIRFQTVVAA